MKTNPVALRNYKFLNYVLKQIINHPFDEKMTTFFAVFAANNPSGCYFWKDFEKYLVDVSNKLPVPREKNQQTDKNLIIMSEAYETGGHTRIVEKIIQNSADRSHDLYMTRAKEVPEHLSNICKARDSKIILSTGKDLLDKAVHLRTIGCGYRKIVLFTHPEDFLPILAFGYQSHNKPIALYNHAEHRTWFCASITDEVWDLSIGSSNNTVKLRDSKSKILGIPVEKKSRNNEVNQKLRKMLKIPLGANVFLSTGADYKFLPYGTLDMRVVVNDILEKLDNSFFVLIGIGKRSLYLWKALLSKFQQRLIILSSIPYESFRDHYNIADVYIDSIPVGGFTAILEAASLDTPVIYLKSKFCYPSCLEHCAFLDLNSLSLAAVEIIKDNYKYNLYKADISFESVDSFIRRYKEFVSSLQKNSEELNNKLDHKKSYLDLDKDSFTSYILMSCYKNKTSFDYKIFSDLNLKHKAFILSYLLLNFPSLFFKLLSGTFKYSCKIFLKRVLQINKNKLR